MRAERTITKRSDFRRLYSEGKRARRDGLTVFVAPRARPELPTRLGLTVSASAGSSVARNRIKRRLRAASAIAAPPTGVDVVVRADRALASASFQEMVQNLDEAVESATRSRS